MDGGRGKGGSVRHISVNIFIGVIPVSSPFVTTAWLSW